MAKKKLYELLAVEGQLKGQAQATRTELIATFGKKRHLFEKKVSTFQSNEEGAQPVTESQLDIQSTVPSELRWLAGLIFKALDVSYSVAVGNMTAVADVVLDNGTVLIAAAPSTALLELEKRAAEIQAVVDAIPTLDPAKGFSLDLDQGEGVYKAREVTKVRTKKAQRVITLAPATPEHPAQAQLVSEDVPTGTLTEREWSGMFTPAQKADMLERAEELRRSIKAALQRANAVEVDTDKSSVGSAVLSYVFGTTK